MITDRPLEALLRRDRAVVLGGLSAVTALSWLYLFAGAGMDMSDMEMAATGMTMPGWTGGDFVVMTVMWVVMMAAMMLPSAAPMALLFAAIVRRQGERGGTYVPTAVFVLGYIVVWSAFSVAATVLQAALDQGAVLTPAMRFALPWAGGAVLVAAGLYQMTPLKDACLRHCRSPLDFVTQHWRKGRGGAFLMGLEHGLYCLGCCWMLMALLFVGGVMNLLWIAAIALFVLIEKTAPGGSWISRGIGAALIVWGAVVLARAAGLVGGGGAA